MWVENRAERIAGVDGRITQSDIDRLSTHDNHWDLSAAKKVLPSSFFRQLEHGKWFGIGEGSDLSRLWYLAKLNQIESNYLDERVSIHSVQQKQSNSLKTELPRGYESVMFWRTLRLAKPFMRGQDVQIFQQLLSSKWSQYNCASSNWVFDWVFGPQTQSQLKKYQRDVLWQGGDGVMDMWGQTMISLTWNAWNPNPSDHSNLQARVSTRNAPVTPNIRSRNTPQTRTNERLSSRNIEAASQYFDAVVGISSSVGNGSGSFIAPNVIMTAAHVVGNGSARNMKIENMNGSNFQVESIARIPWEDVAFITVKQSSTNNFNLNVWWSVSSLNDSIMLWTHNGQAQFRFADQDKDISQVKRGQKLFNTSYSNQDIDNDWQVNRVDHRVTPHLTKRWYSGAMIISPDGKPLWMATWAFHNWNGAGMMEPIRDLQRAYARFLQVS